MTDLDDHELLTRHARADSEAAFTVLVTRYVNLVYSAARRFTGNPHHAQEITQAVFIILARKAGHLRRGTVLSGWLYQTTRLTAANFVKSEIRRQRREQEAYMQSTLNEPESPPWERIAPLLDEAMGRLGETDRNAVVLRFFENKTAQEVGVALKLTEAAAHKRVNRALEKLRKLFTQHGVTFSAVAIAEAVSANSVQAAPVGLAATVTAAAVKGAAVSGSTLTLIKGALKIMAWTKAKTAIVVGVGVLLAAGTTTVAVNEIHKSRSDDAMWELTVQNLTNLPPVLILRPSKFAQGGGRGYNSRFIGKRFEMPQVLEQAYGYFPASRIRYLTTLPSGRYDLMLTLKKNPKETLREEIKKRFGLVAHTEMITTDVFLLKTIETGPRNLKLGKGWGQAASHLFQETSISINNRRMDDWADVIEGFLRFPVVNRTGLTNNYDFEFSLNTTANYGEATNIATLKRALLDQLGFKLVSSREPVEMLVVEKVK